MAARTRRVRWLAIAVCIAIVFFLYERSALENVSYPDSLSVGGGSVLRNGDGTEKSSDPESSPLSPSPHREPGIAGNLIEPERPKMEVKLPEEQAPEIMNPTGPERPLAEEEHLPDLTDLPPKEKPVVLPEDSETMDDLKDRIDPLYKPPTTTSTAPPVHWSKQPETHPITSTRILPTGTPKPIPRIQHEKKSPAEPERLSAVKKAAQHAWKGYRTHGWGFDEVRPVSGKGKNSFNGWGATLVDSLDTLWIMGMKEEFEDAVNQTSKIDFTTSSRDDIPMFEVTIRYLGGLVAAYDVSGRKYQVLMDKALELGEILYAAFDTNNRMPETYYKWKPPSAQNYVSPSGNGRHRVVLAELGTLSLEFTRLAQLSGENKYYDAIARIADAFEEFQNRTRLPGMWPISVDASGCGRATSVTPSRKEVGQNVPDSAAKGPVMAKVEDLAGKGAAKASDALETAKDKVVQPPLDSPVKQSTADTIGPEVELPKEPDVKALAEAKKTLLKSQDQNAHMDAAMEKMDKNVANPMARTGKQTDLRNPSEHAPEDPDRQLAKRHVKRLATEPDAAALAAAEKILKNSENPEAHMDAAMEAMDKNVANPVAHMGEQSDLRAQPAYHAQKGESQTNTKRQVDEAYVPDAAALAAAEKILKDSMNPEGQMDKAMEAMDKNVANPMAHTGEQNNLRAQPACHDQEKAGKQNSKRQLADDFEPDAAALADAEKILKASQDPEAHMDAAMERMDKNVANPMAHTGKDSDLRNPSEHAPKGSRPEGGHYKADTVDINVGDAPYKAGMGTAYTISHPDDTRAHQKTSNDDDDELSMVVQDFPEEEETCIPQGLEAPSKNGVEVYTLGGQSDSVYEYFPKEYLLLGGQVEQYKSMYLASTKPIIEKLLFRPMTPDNLDILISGELHIYINYTTELPYEEMTPKNEHLTCFAGGMFAMGGKIFNEPSHVEIGRKLTDGCVWGYNATGSGIMPEVMSLIACDDMKDCKWNETKWTDELDPYLHYREEQRKQFYATYPDYVETTEAVAGPTPAPKAKTVDMHPKPKALASDEGEDPFNAHKKRQLDDDESGTSRTTTGPEEAPAPAPAPTPAKLGPASETILDSLPYALPEEDSSFLDPENIYDDDGPIYKPTPPKTHEQYIASKLATERLPKGFTTMDRKYILRPEAIESVFYMFRITGEQYWRDVGWKMFQSIEKATKAEFGHSAIRDVTRSMGDGGKLEGEMEEVEMEHRDEMESFWLAETLKYFYLLFCESGEWGLDEWVLNTEAHFFRRPDAGKWDGMKRVD